MERSQWAAANLRLRLSDADGAARLFRALAAHSAELRRPAWEACWGAGLDPGRILETAAPYPDALRQYCQYLAERGRWQALAAAVERAAAPSGPGLDPQRWAAIFDRLFEQAAAVPAARLRGLSGDEHGAWAARPVDGVLVRQSGEAEGETLEIEFAKSQNLFYAGATRDLLVEPGRRYRVSFEAAAVDVASGCGLQVEVISRRRRLAATGEFRRTTGWRAVELEFRPQDDEGFCRLRVVRSACQRLDNRISGRFLLRRLRVIPPA